MPKQPVKSQPIKNGTNGPPVTPSGSGVVLPPAREASKTTQSNKRATPANGSKSKTGNWYDEEPAHDPRVVSAGLHRLADQIYSPSAPGSRSRSAPSKANGTVKKATASTRTTTAKRLPNGRTRSRS
jgi:hypothetical protein